MDAKWIKRKNIRKAGRILREIHSKWKHVRGGIGRKIGFDDEAYRKVNALADFLDSFHFTVWVLSYPFKRWNVSLPQEYIDVLNMIFKDEVKERGREFLFPAFLLDVRDFALEELYSCFVELDEKCIVLGKGSLKNELNALIVRIQDCYECIEIHRELVEDDCNRAVFRFNMHSGVHNGDRELN